MFKGFYSTAGSTMNLEQAKEVMQKVAYAANVSGVDVEPLKVTLDNLGSGVADTATDFGRFIKSLGLSTEAMTQAKKEGKLYELMLEKLSPLQESVKAQSLSYSVAMGRLHSAFDDIKRSMLSEYFEKVKASIANMTEFLTKNQERILVLMRTCTNYLAKVWEGLQDLSSFLLEVFGDAVQWIASCFRESNSELDTFSILLKTIQTISLGIIATFQVIIESVKLAINSFKPLLNNALATANAVQYALSFGKDREALDSFNKRIANNESIWRDMKDNVSHAGNALVDSYTQILNIWNKQQQEVNKSVKENATSLVAKKQIAVQQQVKTTPINQKLSR